MNLGLDAAKKFMFVLIWWSYFLFPETPVCNLSMKHPPRREEGTSCHQCKVPTNFASFSRHSRPQTRRRTDELWTCSVSHPLRSSNGSKKCGKKYCDRWYFASLYCFTSFGLLASSNTITKASRRGPLILLQTGRVRAVGVAVCVRPVVKDHLPFRPSPHTNHSFFQTIRKLSRPLVAMQLLLQQPATTEFSLAFFILPVSSLFFSSSS